MSLIHEALKKAEQQRRLGEPPGLATPFARSPRQRSLLPYLAAAIVIALGAGWFLTRDTAAPEKSAPATANSKTATTTPAAATGGGGAPAASGADPASASSAAERRPTMGANAVANTNVVTTLAPPPRLNNQASAQANPPTVKEVAERESEPHPPGANPLAPGEAAPLTLGAAPPETPADDPAGLASKMAVKERERGAEATPPPIADSGRSPFIKDRPSMPPTQTAKSPRPATPPAIAQTPAPSGAAAGLAPPDRNPPATAPGTPAPAATPPAPRPLAAAPNAAPPPLIPPANAPVATATPSAATPPAPPLEQLPVYWQLPYNVRKELPELKMSMHVYSATPAQRFVVLNGNRQVEGDELGGDVRVSEIRKDGVVLIFQGQRFIVPRGGS
jgi:general secretion pathway protein B